MLSIKRKILETQYWKYTNKWNKNTILKSFMWCLSALPMRKYQLGIYQWSYLFKNTLIAHLPLEIYKLSKIIKTSTLYFPHGSDSKESAYNVGDRFQSLGQEDPLEKKMAPHSSTLAWKIPWMEEPGGLQPIVSQRVRHDWATSLTYLPYI